MPAHQANATGLMSWLRVERMFALFVKFVLELEALVVGLCGANGFDDGGDPIVHVPLAELASSDGAVTGIVIGKAAVPPDAGVDVFGQAEVLLVAAGFAGGAIEVDEVGVGDHGVRGFVLASVVIDAGGFLFRAAGLAAFAVENVDDIVVGLIELSLGEKGKQMLVAAVAVDDEDLLAAVARHFIGGFLEQLQLEFHTVGDGSRFVLGFENLSEIILRKDEGELLLGGLQ